MNKNLYLSLFLCCCLLLIMGCQKPTETEVVKEPEDIENKEKFKPGKFEPGNFEPGNFEPGTFEPGTFEPGTFEPGTFEPGTFTPGTFEPGEFKPGTFSPHDFAADIKVKKEENEISIEVPSDLFFDFDRSDLKEMAITTLKQIGNDLVQYDAAVVHVHGHTDSTGNENYNLKLSEERANEVKKYLELIVNPENIQIETIGHGQMQPIASNDSEEGRAKNRRVEIIIEPLRKSE